ncbi:hypothetical protein CEXT_673591 [Caerostris extrusa]|uniref:Uncharacterized protein n=1 Tax=Caerostris extrusa TaxID=172846 RepID=A0AAV4QCS7_CAEEX|nr:hypothetical protein CEXT_673591 [Caerostris extrusa]
MGKRNLLFLKSSECVRKIRVDDHPDVTPCAFFLLDKSKVGRSVDDITSLRLKVVKSMHEFSKSGFANGILWQETADHIFRVTKTAHTENNGE